MYKRQIYRECVTEPFQQADAELKQKITDVTSGIVAQKTEALMDYYGELVEAADIDWLDDLTYRPKVNMSDSLTSDVYKRQIWRSLSCFSQYSTVRSAIHAMTSSVKQYILMA